MTEAMIGMYMITMQQNLQLKEKWLIINNCILSCFYECNIVIWSKSKAEGRNDWIHDRHAHDHSEAKNTAEWRND